MGFDCIIFDLDDTLYPGNSGIRECVKRNIEELLVQKRGFSNSKASNLRVELFQTYGSTLAGLRALGYHHITHQDYHSFVHGTLPYSHFLKPDAELRNLLSSIPQRKLIFTNSDMNHALMALHTLGITHCFNQIICFETINNDNDNNNKDNHHLPFLFKPSLDAFRVALRAGGVSDPRRALFLDDSPRNIAAAKRMGLQTVVVGSRVKCKGADYAVESVHHLAQLIPHLFCPLNITRTITSSNSNLEEVDHDHDASPAIASNSSLLITTTTPTIVGA